MPYITEKAEFISPKDCDHEYVFEKDKKYFINIGSVGQPRDADNRSCYVIWEGDRVRWRRIDYDHGVTAKKIFDTPDLDPRAGDRLALGR